ncbi:beta-sandwich domain [Cardinium endosymbiont of Sogatella furcifera]|uniref:FoF1 ATP synthase subunit delta/epsilon n=1 Tax=Cardinium endosymbiont of Sogatella furcifera TaxID=650378 RepID=UPI000E0D7842|nr:F0F1 ATP synthase subunit epsilon [Cardinium endosymbiont of Sogatella furcifera]AXI24297.1 beta-sandwich domain [Cardinium endosymbiont of Sogatella furcifera]
MHLSIIAPNRRLFNGEVDSVMLPGALGPFQVLSDHAPTLSSFIAGKITYTVGSTSSSLSVKGGFTSVANNQVRVVCEPSV